MSYELTERIWNIEFHDPEGYVGRPSLKLVMLALARHATDEGDVLSIPRAQLMSEAAIRQRSYWGAAIRVLERERWLDRVPGKGAGNYSSYLLDAEKIHQVSHAYAQLRRVS